MRQQEDYDKKMALIDSILLSKKRYRVIESLFYSDKTQKQLVMSLKLQWSLLKEPVKQLKDEEFIIQDGKKYSLSKIGRIMYENTLPLLDMVETFSKNPDYWISRDLSSVPKYLARNIGKMKDCNVYVPHPDHMFEPLMELLSETYKAVDLPRRNIKICLVLFYSETLDVLLEQIEQGCHISLILAKHVYDRMLKEFKDQLKFLLESENVDIFVFCENKLIPQIAITDIKVLVIFFNQKKKYDYHELLSYDKSTLAWATELFSYYKQCSEHITLLSAGLCDK